MNASEKEVEETNEENTIDHFRGGRGGGGRGGGSSGLGLAASGAALGTVASGSSASSGLATVYCLKNSSSFFCQLLLFLNTLQMIIMVVVILGLIVTVGYFAYNYFYKSKGSSGRGSSKSRK